MNYQFDLNTIRSIPIIKVIDILGLNLCRGSFLQCSSPLHSNDDKTPSLKAYQDSNSWYCFTCRRGGSVIDLVIRYKRIRDC